MTDPVEPLTEIRVTRPQLEELKRMCVTEPAPAIPMWPAILGIPIVVVDDPADSTLTNMTWQQVHDAAEARDSWYQ